MRPQDATVGERDHSRPAFPKPPPPDMNGPRHPTAVKWVATPCQEQETSADRSGSLRANGGVFRAAGGGVSRAGGGVKRRETFPDCGQLSTG